MTERLEIVSPVDGSLYWSGHYDDDHSITTALQDARRASLAWARTPVVDRVQALRPFVDAVARRRVEAAEMLTWQMGRPHHLADESGVFVDLANFYLDDAPRALADTELNTCASERRFVQRVPYGVCLSICAWNYPIGMAAGQIIGPLVAGNVVLFKHAPQVARIGHLLEECAVEAGLPNGVFRSLLLTHEQSERLLGTGSVRGLFFIGSTRGGLAVRRASAGQFVHEHLELGGSDPAYIRHDADLEFAANQIVDGGYSNAGQSCCSVERVFVARDIADQFEEALGAAVAARVTIGHPFEEESMIGPLVTKAAADRVRGLVQDATNAGAIALLPTPPALSTLVGGAYVAPQILIDTTADMRIRREEIFGPVVCVERVDNDEHAVALMNDSEFGLTASIWTDDLERGLSLCSLLEAGVTYVNRCDYVDELLPWGGVKRSGLGRMDGKGWADSLTEPKGVYLRSSQTAPKA